MSNHGTSAPHHNEVELIPHHLRTSYNTDIIRQQQNRTNNSQGNHPTQRDPHNQTNPQTNPRARHSTNRHQHNPTQNTRQTQLRTTRRQNHRPSTSTACRSYTTSSTRNQPTVSLQLDQNETNAHENMHWGQDSWAKPANSCRIYYQNINGVQYQHNKPDFTHDFQSMEAANIDVVAWTETNVNWHLPGIRDSAYTTARNLEWKGFKFTTSNHKDPNHKRLYQPGGTCMAIKGKWASYCTETTQDQSMMGRWTELHLRGANNTRLVMICAYRTCHLSNPQDSHNSAYAQQWRHLRKTQDNPNPRQQILDDLTTRIQYLKRQGNKIIILMDANESTQATHSKIQRFLNDNNLVNAHTTFHATDQPPIPGTHIRGSRQIDFIFISPDLTQAVNGCGIDAFNTVFHSDHRGLFMDINLNQVLGHDTHPSISTSGRVATGKDPRIFCKYQQHVWDYLTTHNFAERLKRYQQTTSQLESDNAEVKKLTTGLDNDITRAMLHAEKQCKSIPRHPWSPKLHNAKAIVRYWKLRSSGHKNNRDVTTQLAKMEAEIDWTTSQPPHQGITTLQQSQHQLRHAKRTLKAIQQEAAEHREEHLKQRATYWAGVRNTTTASCVKQIIAREKAGRTYKKLQHVLKQQQKAGISILSIPNPTEPSERITLLDHDEIAEALQVRNRKHFHQAHGSPLTQSEVVQHFGKYGEAGLQALETFDHTSVDASTSQLLQGLSNNALKPINPRVTSDDIQEGFKRWRERTSTSPSGRHLGHYHALLAPNSTNPTMGNELKALLFDAMATILNTCNAIGFALPRWQQVHNTMLPKIAGNPNIEKVRVIHIIEADHNLHMSILWRRLQTNAEKHNVLGEFQWGARSGKDCISAVLIKILGIDITTLTRTQMQLIDNDAKSCYDRINMLFALLRCQQLGLPKTTCGMIGDIMENTTYTVKTGNGINTKYSYKSSNEVPLYGSPQGGKASPAIWTNVSTAAMQILHNTYTGAKYTDPTNQIITYAPITAFVDDSSISNNNFDEDIAKPDQPFPQTNTINNTQHLQAETQAMGQDWSNLLWSTGGLLELAKCLCYTLVWYFTTKGNPKPRRLADIYAEMEPLTLQNPTDNSRMNIPQKEAQEAHRTLGVRITTTGCQKAEIRHLQEKARTFADKLKNAPYLGKADGYLLHRAFVQPSLAYSLPVTSMNQHETESIERKIWPTLLNKMGFNRNYPRAMLFGPNQMGGLGKHSMYALQGTEHAMLCLKYLRQPPSIVSNHLRIAIRWYHKVAGIPENPLTETTLPLPYLPKGFITTTRNFLQENQFHFKLPIEPNLPPRRVNDANIMMDAIKSPLLTDKDLHKINGVRLFLQVEYISDLCTIQGNQLSPSSFTWPTNCSPSSSTGLWPRQGKPPKSHFSATHRYLKQRYCISPNSNYLRKPLGAWLQDHNVRKWPTYFHPATQEIYFQRNHRWHKANTLPQRSRTRPYLVVESSIRPTDTLPDSSYPIEYDDKTQQCTRTSANEHGSTSDDLPSNEIHPNTDPQPKHWDHELLSNTAWLPSRDHCITKIKTYLATHASPTMMIYATGRRPDNAHTKKGKFCAIIHIEDSPIAVLRGTVFGHPATANRCQAFSLLAGFRFLRTLENLLPAAANQHTRVELVCSHKPTIARLGKLREYGSTWYPSVELQPDSDIFKQLIHEENSAHTNWDILYRQQEKDNALHGLATDQGHRILDDIPCTLPHINHVPTCTAYIADQHQTYSSDERPTLLHHHGSTALKKFLTTKFQWQPKLADHVHWDALGLARQKRQNISRFISEYLCNWIATNARLHVIQHTSPGCPLCGELETVNHLYTCPRRNQWKLDFLAKLSERLTDLKTPSTLQTKLLHTMARHLRAPRQQLPHCTTTTTPIFPHQTALGADSLFRGFLSTEWSTYINRTTTNNYGQIWTTQVIIFIWDEIHSLWTQRNNTIHNPQDNTTDLPTNTHQDHLIHQITKMYEAELTISPTDRRFFFNIPLERRTHMPKHQMEEWLKFNQKPFKQAQKAYQQIQTQHQTTLHEWTDNRQARQNNTNNHEHQTHSDNNHPT